MKWKIIIIASIPIGMILLIVGIMIFGHASKEEIQNIQEKYGLGGKMLSAQVLDNPTKTIYTPNSETTCIKGVCTQTSYSSEVFLDEQGHTFTDLSNFYYLNGDFIFEFNGTKTVIRPYGIVGGNKVYLKDFTLATTNKITKNRFDWKYSFDISGVTATPSTTISQIGFEIINKSKLIDLDYNDLIKSNFTINKTNLNDVTVSNIAINVKEGKLSLDPTITLGTSAISQYYDNLVATGLPASARGYAISTRWLITSIPLGGTINNATMCFYEIDDPEEWLGPDNDLNLSRINNQTFTFANNDWKNNQLTNSTTGEIWNSTSASSWWCTNVTVGLITDYNLGNSYSSWMFLDPDALKPFVQGIMSSGVNIYFGQQLATAQFSSLTYSPASLRPYMSVTYTVPEYDAPNVYLLAVANNSYNNASQIINLSCNVTDASNLSSNSFYTNRRKGIWESAKTNTTTGLGNSTVYNYSFIPKREYYDGLQYCNLAGSNVTLTSRIMKQLNSTHWVWVKTSSPDMIYITNSTCGPSYNWSAPSTDIQDVYSNDTFIWFADWLSKTIYVTDKVGNAITNYVLPDLPWGIDSNDNGQTLWVVNYSTGTTFTHIWSMNGAEISRFTDTRPMNPKFLVASNTTLWTVDTFALPDQISEFDIATGLNTYNISLATIGITGSSATIYGLAKDFNDNIVDRLYTTISTGSNELTAIERNTTGPITWNCYACDIYNNCGFNSTNWSYNYGTAPSANCWTYNAGSKLLTIPTGCLYNCTGGICLT